MTSYPDTVTELRTLHGWQVALFGAGCLTRASPFVTSYGTAITQERFEAAMRDLWTQAGRLTQEQAAQHLVAFEQAAEDHEDVETDQDPRYWVMCVLSVLACTVAASQVMGEEPVDVDDVEAIVAGTLDIFGNLDAVMDRELAVDPGPMKQAEIQAQQTCLHVLRSSRPADEQAGQIRELSNEQARQLMVPPPSTLL